MKRGYLILISLGVTLAHSVAQPVAIDSLDIHGVRALLHADGYMFWDPASSFPRFEAPAGSGMHSFYAGQLWLTAVDTAGQLRVMGPTFGQTGRDMWAGPVASNYQSPAYSNRYNRVWKVNKSVVDAHIQLWNTPGYPVPPELADWPAHGDTTNGEAYFLAPFVDVDQNQKYEPQLGDYPEIKGDQALFFITNDLKQLHTESGGQPLGVEIHGMLYGYGDPADSALWNTVFLSYRVINRTVLDYPELNVGFFGDFDIGFAADDYAGCDLSLNMAFAYNSDSSDLQYGNHPPAQGILWLSDGLAGFHIFKNDFSDLGNPEFAQHYHGYLNGFWKNGAALTVGGNGNQGTTVTRCMYPGDPVTGTGWTMNQSGFLTGTDVRSVTILKDQTLNANGVTCLDLAFPFAQDSNGSHITAITKLRQYAGQVSQFYNGQQVICQPLPVLTTSINASNPAGSLIVKTLPEGLEITWPDFPAKLSEVEVFDLQGRSVRKQAVENTDRFFIESGAFPAGMYLIRVRNHQASLQQKIMVGER